MLVLNASTTMITRATDSATSAPTAPVCHNTVLTPKQGTSLLFTQIKDTSNASQFPHTKLCVTNLPAAFPIVICVLCN